MKIMNRIISCSLSTSDKETIIKFLLCTVSGILFAWIIGDPYTATTAVTANLILYVDRGFAGSIHYGWKRLEVQIIQGGLVLFAFFLLNHISPLGLPDPAKLIIACCIAISIGLPLHYIHPIAPLTTTLANATFVMACGILSDANFYFIRIFHCLGGAIIGLLINWVIMPQHDRFTESLENLSVCCSYLNSHIQSVLGKESSCQITDKKYKESLNLLKTNMQHIETDNRYLPKKKTVSARRLKQLIFFFSTISIYEDMLELANQYALLLDSSFVQYFLQKAGELSSYQESCITSLKAGKNLPKKRKGCQRICPYTVTVDLSPEQWLFVADLIRLEKMLESAYETDQLSQ